MSHRAFSVGLTGGIGSGKTTVANMFEERGAAVIDTDQIAHQLTAAGGGAIAALRKEFGSSFLTSAGALDRAKMRSYVFTDPAAKARLESILHPLIQEEAENMATQVYGTYLVFVVPLLAESTFWRQRVSRVLVVDCPEKLQISRVMQRSGLTKDQVQAIMAAQISRHERLKIADDVIENKADTLALLFQVDQLHMRYQTLAGN